MTRRHSLLLLPLVATLAAACGGGDDAADGEEGSATDTSALAADADGQAAARPAADSVPMEITVTTTGGSANNNGTFSSRGMGQRCTHDPDAPPGVTRAAWNVVFAGDSTGIEMLNLEVGAPTDGTTSTFALTLAAGTSTAAGVTMPMRYMVATWPGGSKLGSGAVTVQRVGDGARFTVNAVDGASKTRIAMTVTCARLGAVD